jgi:hypothetical protein
LQNCVVPTSGIEGPTEVVSPLRRPIIGMAEERLSDADMFGIADRQLGRN